MKPDDLLGLAEYLVSFGKKKGADQVEISILESSEFSLDVRLGEIENLLEAESRYLTLKVIKNKKTAYATSSLLKKEPLQDLINNAVTRAALANPDEFSGLPSLPPEPRDVSLLKLFDPEIAELDSRTKIALALETEAMALKNPKITNSHGSSFETREVKTILSNSKGLSGVYTETLCSLGVGLQAGETDNRVEGYWSSTTRHFKELEPPETIAKKAVSRTLRQINPIKIKTQRVPVVFEPEMTSWIMGFLFACVSGISIYNRASFLVDKLDKKIGNDRIQVVDDGLMPGKLGSAPFDSEGVPCQRTILIERGVLKNYLCNTYAARKLNLTSTGNSSGNGVGPTNFYLKPGSTTPEEMIKSMDKGMILIRTLGHGLNPINGDISRGAFGLWVEGGEIVYPVSEITISGNLGTLLKETEMIGNDLEYRSPVSGPSIKIQELLVAGK
jgi:PmbA protein